MTNLAEMPVTPIGKVYKPALRALATQKAIEEALARIGVREGEFTITIDEAESRIRLADPSRAEIIRRALTGMPIHYVIEERSKKERNMEQDAATST